MARTPEYLEYFLRQARERIDELERELQSLRLGAGLTNASTPESQIRVMAVAVVQENEKLRRERDEWKATQDTLLAVQQLNERLEKALREILSRLDQPTFTYSGPTLAHIAREALEPLDPRQNVVRQMPDTTPCRCGHGKNWHLGGIVCQSFRCGCCAFEPHTQFDLEDDRGN
jgi:hypothetical protein